MEDGRPRRRPTVGNGPVWVSSQLATLEVAAPVRGVRDGAGRRRAGQGRRSCSARCSSTRRSQGKAKVKLVGLPPKVTTPEVEITKDTKELAFKLTIDKTSPAGQHRNLFCQVVRHAERRADRCTTSAARELRIDVPLPPKAERTPPSRPTPAATPAARARPAAGEAADAAGEAAAGAGRAREGGKADKTRPRRSHAAAAWPTCDADWQACTDGRHTCDDHPIRNSPGMILSRSSSLAAAPPSAQAPALTVARRLSRPTSTCSPAAAGSRSSSRRPTPTASPAT